MPFAKWLGQEFHCPSLHGAHAHWDVPMSGHKDDGKVDPVADQLLLQLETVQAGQADVENQASRRVRPVMPQKFLRGREGFHAQLNRPDQTAERLPNGRIIVNDEHGRRRGRRICFHVALFAFTGRVNWKVTPWSSLRVARKRPPWASMIERLMDKPRPNPCGL